MATFELGTFQNSFIFIRYIKGNHLQCDCGILELKAFLLKLLEYDTILCYGPNEHTDHALLTIPDISLCDKRGKYTLFCEIWLNSWMSISVV